MFEINEIKKSGLSYQVYMLVHAKKDTPEWANRLYFASILRNKKASTEWAARFTYYANAMDQSNLNGETFENLLKDAEGYGSTIFWGNFSDLELKSKVHFDLFTGQFD